jgi:hypothetical protein
MKELPSFDFVAFILPLMTAFAGMRLSRWILGQKFEEQFGFGFRFAFGLGVGMLVLTQAVLLCAVMGFNGAALLAWLAIIGGGVEIILRVMKLPQASKSFKFQVGHWWLLLLLPLLYSWWVFGQLSTLEGTLEFDANAFWVFKSKIFFMDQGKQLIDFLHQTNLAYMHNDYPLLVPLLYTLGYGAVGGVDEFVNKVWPFWMMVALSVGILSFARIWKNPRPLPIIVVTLIGFLPATLLFIRNEGGTIPMVFGICMATLLFVRALSTRDDAVPPAILLAFAVCFAIKLEGAVFAAFCCCALLPLGLKRGWLKNKSIWVSAAVAAASVVPYALYRLTKPIAHPESHWMNTFVTGPGPVLQHFPQVLFLNITARFFNSPFYQWTDNNGHLQWTGHWTGLDSLANTELSVLPWLLLVLLVLSLIFKPRRRIAIGAISAVILGVFTFLSFVVACLPRWDLTQLINLACNISGRHYYPFFTAWYLGIVALWFMNEESPSQVPEPEKKSSVLTPQKSKRQH